MNVIRLNKIFLVKHARNLMPLASKLSNKMYCGFVKLTLNMDSMVPEVSFFYMR